MIDKSTWAAGGSGIGLTMIISWVWSIIPYGAAHPMPAEVAGYVGALIAAFFSQIVDDGPKEPPWQLNAPRP